MSVGHHDSIRVPYLPLGDHLTVSVQFDLDNAMRYIGDDELKDWGVTLKEALQAARDNLWTISNESFVEVAPGVYRSPWQDNRDAARLFLHDLIWQLPVQGQHVTMVPNRDVLLVTGSENLQGLDFLAKTTEELLQDGRFISGIPAILDGRVWKTWRSTGSEPAHLALARLHALTIAAEYEDQASLLREQFEQQGDDVFVASVMVTSNPKSGETRNVAVWDRGTKTSLPRVDELVFVGDMGNDAEEAIVAWGVAVEIVGDLMELQGIYPERFLVSAFPNDAQWQQLKATDCDSGRG